MKPSGFIVVEKCEEYEQPLGLKLGAGTPPGGVLEWTNGARAVFASRAAAKAAIDRNEHFRLAFGDSDRPEKKFCQIVPVIQV